MRQAWHILQKDFLYLRSAIALYCALCALFASGLLGFAGIAEALLSLAALYVSGRLVQAERLPGTDQFWISRPYRWTSLLSAKLAFVAVVLDVPLFAARFYMLEKSGFASASFLPGLLWSHLLLLLLFGIPICALAALTKNLAELFLGVLGICVVVTLIMRAPKSPGPMFFDQLQWFWNAAIAVILVAAGVAILLMQYRYRRTRFSAVLGASGLVCGAAVYLLIPASAAIAFEVAVSAKPLRAATLTVQLDPSGRPKYFPAQGAPPTGRIWLDFPLRIAGLPRGMTVRGDGLEIELRAPDGRTWRTGRHDAASVETTETGVLNSLVLAPDRLLIKEEKSVVAVRGRLYATIFGGRQSVTIPVRQGDFAAAGTLRCGLGSMQFFYCSAPLRWPERLVGADFGEGGLRTFTHSVSYSPFPAGIGLSTVESDMIAPAEGARSVNIVTEQPIEHTKLDFAFGNVRLAALREQPR